MAVTSVREFAVALHKILPMAPRDATTPGFGRHRSPLTEVQVEDLRFMFAQQDMRGTLDIEIRRGFALDGMLHVDLRKGKLSTYINTGTTGDASISFITAKIRLMQDLVDLGATIEGVFDGDIVEVNEKKDREADEAEFRERRDVLDVGVLNGMPEFDMLITPKGERFFKRNDLFFGLRGAKDEGMTAGDLLKAQKNLRLVRK